MTSDRIKTVREQHKMTQAELAKQLGITRSSVNAWELGVSVPSAQYLVELSKFFKVSTDYILGLDSTATIPLDGLTEDDINLMNELANHLRNNHKAM